MLSALGYHFELRSAYARAAFAKAPASQGLRRDRD